MNNAVLGAVKDCLDKVSSFIYETPLNDAVIAIAGVTASIFAPKLAPLLLVLSGTTTLTRLAFKGIERYNPNLSIQINEKIDKTSSEYGSLYMAAFIAAIIASMVFPILGIPIGICLGIYRGLAVEIQIQKTKQDANEQSTRYNLFDPSTWKTPY